MLCPDQLHLIAHICSTLLVHISFLLMKLLGCHNAHGRYDQSSSAHKVRIAFPSSRFDSPLLTCQKGEGGSLHGCSVQQARAHAARPEACEHPRGVGPVGGALPCDVGQEVDTTGACWLLLCQLCDGLMVQPKRFAYLWTGMLHE